MPGCDICSIEGCERKRSSRGWCKTHYSRWFRHGDPNITLAPSHHEGYLTERFWAKVQKTETCWQWLAGTDGAGYGSFRADDKTVGAHIFSYNLQVGEVPVGLQLDHTCHNHRCVNPKHLRPATPKQNCENRPNARPENVSGIRGVSWIPGRQGWLARVFHNGKPAYSQFFTVRDEAEAAVVAARNNLFTHNDADRHLLVDTE